MADPTMSEVLARMQIGDAALAGKPTHIGGSWASKVTVMRTRVEAPTKLPGSVPDAGPCGQVQVTVTDTETMARTTAWLHPEQARALAEVLSVYATVAETLAADVAARQAGAL